jgi:uncharacterized repeat protein (TIGR01451 family)
LAYHSLFMRSASAAAVGAALGSAAFGASPEAGAVIGNQAVATYTNSAGDTITVTSNTVETIVQQVAGVTLTSDNTETIAPGGKAFLPHIITNEGNGADSFLLTAVEADSGTLDTTQLVFYPDANMDGVADSATPLTSTPVLAPGEQFGVVIEASVASTATGTDTITITATSALDGTELDINTDTLTISNDAIVELVKSMVADAASGGNPDIIDAGDTVTITLTYSSTGLAAANNYVVQDVLDGNLSYVPGSARWSDAAAPLDDDNASTLADGTNGSGETIAWDYDDGQTVNFNISSVASGRSGSVTFQAVVASTANAGLITNVASQDVDGVAFPPSNTASIVVDNQYAIAVADTAINGDGSANGTIASATDDDAANNDIVTETGDVYQGGVIRQEFVLTNLSNQADSMTLQVANVDFPAGTTFRFVGADGVTPVVGSIGPLAIGGSAKVTLIATLPTDLTPTATTNYTATITTISPARFLLLRSILRTVLQVSRAMARCQPTQAIRGSPRQPIPASLSRSTWWCRTKVRSLTASTCRWLRRCLMAGRSSSAPPTAALPPTPGPFRQVVARPSRLLWFRLTTRCPAIRWSISRWYLRCPVRVTASSTKSRSTKSTT